MYCDCNLHVNLQIVHSTVCNAYLIDQNMKNSRVWANRIDNSQTIIEL